ncbi:unnamed protein product, partial [Ectocarpus sp. 12 AP-2014]
CPCAASPAERVAVGDITTGGLVQHLRADIHRRQLDGEKRALGRDRGRG